MYEVWKPDIYTDPLFEGVARMDESAVYTLSSHGYPSAAERTALCEWLMLRSLRLGPQDSTDLEHVVNNSPLFIKALDRLQTAGLVEWRAGKYWLAEPQEEPEEEVWFDVVAAA